MEYKSNIQKVEYAVWHHIRKDTVWRSFEEFMLANGLKPTPKHRFRRPNKSAPFGPGNGGWYFSHPSVPRYEPHAVPTEELEGTVHGLLAYGKYHGHGYWNVVCIACKTDQIRSSYSDTCLACQAQPPEPPNDLPEAKAIRDKKARNTRFYYALKALRSPTRHKSPDAFTKFWQNLPEGKPAQMSYVLNYWSNL